MSTDESLDEPTVAVQSVRPASSRVATLGPGIILAVAGAVAATAISARIAPLSALVVAVVIGAAIGNSWILSPVTMPGLTFAAKRVLRVGVVLLGLRLSLVDVASLGGRGLLIVGSTVGATFFGTQWLGRRMGLSKDLSLLVATGYSICGASAIAAVEGSTDADEEEVAAAIGLVTLFGSLAILVLPLLATVLGLSDAAFGAWVGASVHDVAQVVATASSGGADVVAIAIVVKLSRVVLLAPIVAGVNIRRRKFIATDGPRPPIVPLFVAGFLFLVLVRSSGLLSPSIVDGAKAIEGWLLAIALVGLGSGVRFTALRRLGPQPLVLGLLAWALVASISLLGIVLVLA